VVVLPAVEAPASPGGVDLLPSHEELFQSHWTSDWCLGFLEGDMKKASTQRLLCNTGHIYDKL